MVKDPRKRFLLDKRVQGVLLWRVATYWVLSVLTTGVVLLALNLAKGPSSGSLDPVQWTGVWDQFVSVVVASLFVLPILLVDSLMLSNRFVGPVFRVRRLMRALASGEKVEAIDLRKGDLWPEIAGDFNSLLVYVKMLQVQSQRACHAAPSDADETVESIWSQAR